MASIMFYHRILRLSYSNVNLLKMYYRMLEESKSKSLFEDTIIKERIGIREAIKQELLKWEENSPESHRWLIYMQEPFVASEYKLSHWLRKLTYEHCYNSELANVNLYYDCIYTSSNSRKTNDLLIAQKNKIEKYLIAEIN
ncbi:hypothetical protein [Autumnicola musiva]|uniref:Uncharacterized protein n=1 Tax=Autumnicola musiva TaxID=3075589 RepID=A0ABU3D9P1_9FLAO|nr:hypothetical protein [Zunongwangia sp. F117]MDT0678255.1 hypothetical protein [Zunongwangia sp. F117]